MSGLYRSILIELFNALDYNFLTLAAFAGAVVLMGFARIIGYLNFIARCMEERRVKPLDAP